MGEIEAGDVVFDERGHQCTVTRTTDVMHGRECFAVAFDDGSEIIADAEHQWFTWDKRSRKSHGRAGPGRTPTFHPAVRTTRDIASTLLYMGREVNHSVHVAAPVELPDAELPVDPYLLGAWLGDGTSVRGEITIGAQDHDNMVALLTQAGAKLGKRRKQEGPTAYALGIQAQLRALGVLGDKHIPSMYLRGSVWQRERLLAGLLDTDGHCGNDGTVEFCNTNERLARQVYELVVSLGMKANIYDGRATIQGRDCGPKFRVYIRPRRKLFGLERKNARLPVGRRQENRTSHRYIVAARQVDSVPVRCIEVDSPSHLFLAGRSMIPTHNSWFERFVWYDFIRRWDHRPRPGALRPMTGVRIVLLMPTFKACKDIHGALVEDDLNPNGPWGFLGGKINHTEWKITFPGGSWIQFFGAKEARSARGVRCDIVTPDECDDIDPSVVDAVVKPWFSEPWSLRVFVPGGTPRRGRYGLLYREHRRGILGDEARAMVLPVDASEDERVKHAAACRRYSFHATYRDAPETVDPAYVAEVKAEMEQDGQLAVFEREWECNYDSAEGLVYPMFDESFHVREPSPGSWTEVLVGGDHGWEDPGVLLVIGVRGHGADATCWIIEEVYAQHQIEDWWIERGKDIVKRYPQARWYLDPSRPDRVQAFKQKAGARVQDVDNSIEAGISAVANKLAIRRADGASEAASEVRWANLYVSRKCPRTIEEFGKYRRKRDPRNTDKFLDDVEDKHNHCMDSTKYPLLSRFGGPNRSRSESGPGWQ